ncbi:MAG: ABC transporter permease [Chloroflexota bacterium]|nr:MAG: ABC transporter permease [Chloroflexota bacterium]
MADGDQAGDTRQARAPYIVIRPTRGWASLRLGDVWEYRDLLYFLLWREVKGRYRQMALGPLWIIIQPVVNMIIFSLVFGGLAQLPSDGVPYPLFTYVALLPWRFFATATGSSANSLVSQQHLIAKVYFPRLIIPVSLVLSALVDFLVSFVILVGMLAFYRIAPSWSLLMLPLYTLLAGGFALAIGMWLAGLSVKFRDVALGLNFAILAWQYLTPVAYSSSLVPEHWRMLYRLNPMTEVVDGFRWAILGVGQKPDWLLLAIALAVGLLLMAGAYFFRATERTIVDVL